MIKIMPGEQRFHANHGWLSSRFSFSFAEYHDPANMHFSVMRVLNDDVIQPGTGFGMHPHNNMEIVTYVIEGELEHQDSMGNREVLREGEVQRMTAGTGVYHSEYNASQERPLHLLQMWFFPAERGLTPSWEQRGFDHRTARRNQLVPVVSGRDHAGTLRIHQDMVIYLANTDKDQTITYQQTHGENLHLFVIKGKVALNGDHVLTPGDAARITQEPSISLTAQEEAEWMLIDLP